MFERVSVKIIKFDHLSVDTFARIKVDAIILLMTAVGDSFETMCRVAMYAGVPVVVCEPEDGLYVDGISQGLAELLSGENVVRTNVTNLVRDTLSLLPESSVFQTEVFGDHQLVFGFV